jgi:hypothetical protein
MDNGALWDAYRKHFGKDSPVLIWKAPTRTMNPSVPQRVIDDAIEADPSSAAAADGAVFCAPGAPPYARYSPGGAISAICTYRTGRERCC